MALARWVQVTALAVLALGQSWGSVGKDQLDRKLSPQLRATTARSALAKLSEMSGTPLAVEPALSGEIILVQAKGVTLKDLLARIARVMHAEWEPTKEGYRLARPANITQASEERDRKAFAARLKKLLDAKGQQMAKTPDPYAQAEATLKALEDFNEKAQRGTGLNLDEPVKGSPAGRLCMELVVALGADELAGLPLFQSVVYSSHPTRAERPLPPKAAELIRTYAEAEQRLALLVGEKQPNGVAPPFTSAPFAAALKPGGIGKVLLSISSYGRTLSFGVNIYTKAGDERVFAPGSSYDLGDNAYADEAREAKAAPPRFVELSPTAAEFEKASAGSWDHSRFLDPKPSKVELTERLLEVLAGPETIDPLSLAATDGILAMAKERGKNVIACLPDSVGRVAHLAVKVGRLDVRLFERLLPLTGGTRTAVEGDWLELSPMSPAMTTRFRLPRPALGKFVRACLQAKEIGFETYCRLNFDAGDAMFVQRFASVYQQILEDAGTPSGIGPDRFGPRFYAMLGSLDHAQWLRLERGDAIRIASIGGKVRDAATRYAESCWSLETASGEEVPALMLRFTEALPFGISPDSYVVLRRSDKLVAAASMLNSKGEAFLENRGTDATSLAEGFARSVGRNDAQIEKAVQEGKITSEQAEKYRNPTLEDFTKGQRYRIGTERHYDVRLFVAPDRMAQVTIRGVVKAPKGETVAFKDLPEKFRTQVEQAFRKAMAKPRNQAGSGG
jgi:hypothetical protein